MNPKIIVIDGKTYNSVEAMPPDVLQKYEQAMQSFGGAKSNHIPDTFQTVSSETVNILADKDKNGIPDILENLTAGQAVVNSMKIIVDGKEFNGIENLPPEARTKYEAGMRKLDANQNGIPDFVEGMIKTTDQTTASATSFAVDPAPSSTPLPASPTVTPDTSNGLMLALAGLFVLVLCIIGAGAVWNFFLR